MPIQIVSREEERCMLTGWHRISEPDGSTIAYCPDIVTARLIEAGPQLVAALEKVATCSAYPVTEPGNMAFALSTLRDMARSALAAVKGE